MSLSLYLLWSLNISWKSVVLHTRWSKIVHLNGDIPLGVFDDWMWFYDLYVIWRDYTPISPILCGNIVLVFFAVATLQGHLWSKVCSKFHENRGILKPISRNRYMGVFFTWNFVKPPKKGYISTMYFEFSWELLAINCFQWTCDCAIYNDVRKSVLEIVQTNKLSLYYELVNIYKYNEKSSFKHLSCFLKNRGLLKGFDFFLDFEKKDCFKELKIS